MTRAELIQILVIRECCDHLEDIQQITNWVDELGPKCGLMITHEDILQALRVSIERGWLKAWELTRWAEPVAVDSKVEEIWPMNPRFARTEEGLAFQRASSPGHPLDEHVVPGTLFSREELVRSLIFDSYQGSCTHVCLANIEMRWKDPATRYEIGISREDIIQALRELIAAGHLTASYKEAGFWQYDGMPPLEDIKPFGAYFWVTGDGWDYINSKESWWPFNVDDDGEGEFLLREDWLPPES